MTKTQASKQTHIWLRSPTCRRCFYHMDYIQKRKSSNMTKTLPYFDHLPSPQTMSKASFSAHGPSNMSWIHFIGKKKYML
jgi:hypothetical protein